VLHVLSDVIKCITPFVTRNTAGWAHHVGSIRLYNPGPLIVDHSQQSIGDNCWDVLQISTG
jgi:hypothetical protein